MGKTVRLLSVVLLLLSIVVLSRPALAVQGIYCSSYSFTARDNYMICIVECVYCENSETGEYYEDCYDKVCWFRSN